MSKKAAFMVGSALGFYGGWTLRRERWNLENTMDYLNVLRPIATKIKELCNFKGSADERKTRQLQEEHRRMTAEMQRSTEETVRKATEEAVRKVTEEAVRMATAETVRRMLADQERRERLRQQQEGSPPTPTTKSS